MLSLHTSPQNVYSHQGNLERGKKKTWLGLTGAITVIVEGSESISAGPQGVKSKARGMETVFVGPCEAEEVSESSTVMPEGGAELRRLDPPEAANGEGSQLGAQPHRQRAPFPSVGSARGDQGAGHTPTRAHLPC